ncbi:hypothetical protein E2C01_053728 [Portunus trituberculatus]|uniref:Uncharacterized protein n=1 Tax=Portunus trituberculatus TaxID=210409 RepID=A0A5B7GL46_PORTR|nr:hypothetical protein [Portunus trituberculatus]
MVRLPAHPDPCTPSSTPPDLTVPIHPPRTFLRTPSNSLLPSPSSSPPTIVTVIISGASVAGTHLDFPS